jgi:hypothetical protein
MIDGTLVTDDYEKSKAFSEFFSSVFVPSQSSADTAISDSDCPTLSINEEVVFHKIKELPCKSSITPDGIPPSYFL